MNTSITKDIQKVAKVLKKGEIAAVPTETVYGLAANALDVKAVRKIFKAKRRPSFNPLIVHIARIEDIKKYVRRIPGAGLKILEKFSPGPVTLVLKKNEIIPDIVTAGNDTVAIRVPDNEMFRSLINECGFPLCAPSANMSGRISPTSAIDVKKELNGKISYILDGGKCKFGLESTVISFQINHPVILRHGAITQEQIESVCRKVITNNRNEIDSPGMLKDHYAPKTKLLITDVNFTEAKKIMKNIAVLNLKPHQSLQEFAEKLYSSLRKLDEKKYNYILTSFVSAEDVGRAINDRILKAAYGFLQIENGKVKITRK